MSEFEKLPDRKRLSQYILGNARTLIIAFILFTIVVVMTTDIKLVTISSITDLGLDFFLLLFGSYAMFVTCADGGIAKGYTTDDYKVCVERYDAFKATIEKSYLTRMNDFCSHYCDEALRKMRMEYLSVACIPYDLYMEKYVTLGKKDVKALPLTDPQKHAIRKANAVRRIRFTPEMLMTRGKSVHIRFALPTTPGTMKGVVFCSKFVKMAVISIILTLIAFEVILNPSWTVFAEVCAKLAAVIINGFDGHKEGFNNITVHTVNYVNSQSSLMQQAMQYIDANPTTEITTVTTETTTEISLVETTT